MKKIITTSILIILILVGCSPKIEDQTIYPPLSKPDTEEAKDIIVLSYPNKDLNDLTRVTLELSRNGNISLAQSTILSLLGGKGAQGYYVPFNQKANLINAEVSRNLISLNILGDFKGLNDKEYFSSIISLTNTLTELEGIDYVKLSINDKDFVPTGIFTNPLTHQSEDLYLLFLQHQDYLKSNTGQKPQTTPTYLLYFTDLSGKLLLAEVRHSYQNSDNLALELFNELKNGPSASSEMKSSIPKGVVIQGEPQIHMDGDSKILSMSLEAPKHVIDSKARYIMAASIVTTIQSQMPYIDGVRIMINSQPAFENSIMTASDFNGKLGNIVTLYFPNKGFTHLIPVSRAMSQENYKLPMARLKELMKGVKENESAVSIFPEGVTENDLKSVHITGDVLYVNFTQHFYNSCNYERSEETMLVYTIVNTLTEFNNIRKVQILIEGQVISTLSGHIACDQPLLPNPGIVQK